MTGEMGISTAEVAKPIFHPGDNMPVEDKEIERSLPPTPGGGGTTTRRVGG
jgi:hypothetical protein